LAVAITTMMVYALVIEPGDENEAAMKVTASSTLMSALIQKRALACSG
jgi:hypothetical protein